MGKSAVLKDMSNHPEGYVLQSGESIVCRVRLQEPAQLRLVLSDGSQITHTLESGSREQRFPCEGKAMLGCYAFRGEELLLVSDEAMRHAFAKQALFCRKSTSEQKAGEAAARPTRQEQAEPRNEEKEHVFAQRRWPPPPCWESARYAKGCWREE